MRNFTGWTGYVSATSIYPDKPQGFCYEDTPPEPTMLARRTARRAQKRELFVAESATVDNKRAKRVACE